MRFDLSAIKSFFQPSSKNHIQSASVAGNNNNIIQNIIVADVTDDLKRELLAKGLPPQPSSSGLYFPTDNLEGDDREEIQRIIEYRQISSGGDSATALFLLEKLSSDKRYASGYFAFRLHFNIGVVKQSIGDLENASISLRTAYAHFPKAYKAQTALAFAELLDGENEQALNRASVLMNMEGDHKTLAACIFFHAAQYLKKEIKESSCCAEALSSPDVQAARLGYIREVHPSEYSNALSEAFAADTSNEAIATMWALSILDNMKQNQAFLLGAKMSDGFEENVAKSARILRDDLEKSLKERPPNKLLLPSQANNAAVALRLSGNIAEAARLVDYTLVSFPQLTTDLAQIRAVLLLQEEKYNEALKLIQPLTEVEELQVMASELEAKLGDERSALDRINVVLNSDLLGDLRTHALAVKARIGINALDQNAADEALDELVAVSANAPELVLLQSAYERAFVIHKDKAEFERLPIEKSEQSGKERKLLESLKDANEWDFATLLHASDELLARGYYRECTDLLRDRVSRSKESPALSTLCDACLRGHLGSLAKEISDGLAPEVKNSVFGWKFCANVAYLNGEVAKAVPFTRRLFEQNPKSLSALEWYIQSLLRTNDRQRVQRLIKKLTDWELVGSIQDKRIYVNLLVYCGEIERARAFAYRLFCENQNDHRAWMALSSSVLAFGRPQEKDGAFEITAVEDNSTFEVLKPNGERQTFTIESDKNLFPLREGNIAQNHPVAIAAFGKIQGDMFDWPFDKADGQASLAYVKHKALAAFHFVLQRFEEQFPEASGFKSMAINFEKEDGLDEMKAMLQQRAEYSQSKAKEYHEGSYPLFILGHHLGIDPIDTFLGLKAECGYAVKVSSCSRVEQDTAVAALIQARSTGVIADACACYLIRRLGIEDAVKQEFGPLGVTQETIDIFSRRLQEAEDTSFGESDTGTKRAGSISIRNGQIMLTEQSEEQVSNKVAILRSDLEWLKLDCALVPAVAKADPDDAIIRFRQEKGGQFFDDIFAADGSGRILISEDYHLRQWAEGIFKTRGAWIQALLFHLETAGRIDGQTVVRSTVQLCCMGEDTLSTNAEALLAAAGMLSSGKLSDEEFTIFCSLLGQKGADVPSHIDVSVSAIRALWAIRGLTSVSEKATSIVLRSLTRLQGSDTRVVLNTVQTLLRDERIRRYISGWRVGHFLN